MRCGFSLPIIPFLLVIIIVCIYFFGWQVLLAVAGLVALIALATAVYDRVTHDTKCRYCDALKEFVSNELALDRQSLRTTHEIDFDDHMHIRVQTGESESVLANIDFNAQDIFIISEQS